MEKHEFSIHPIELVDIYPKKLFIDAIKPPSRKTGVKPTDLLTQVGWSDFDEKEQSLMVSVSLTTKKEGRKKLPYEMEVVLVGLFVIDTEKFRKEDIPDWARRASLFVLMPYVREYVYWLTYRCNFKPLVLPLVQVPTIQYVDMTAVDSPTKAKKKKPSVSKRKTPTKKS